MPTASRHFHRLTTAFSAQTRQASNLICHNTTSHDERNSAAVESDQILISNLSRSKAVSAMVAPRSRLRTNSGGDYKSGARPIRSHLTIDTTLAETEGFEPSVGVIPLRRFSKPLVSATHPRLQAGQTAAIAALCAAINRPCHMPLSHYPAKCNRCSLR